MVSTNGLLWGSASFAGAAWLVGLGGLSAVTKDCYESPSFGGVECARVLQFEWWGLWFEFFLILALLVLAARDRVTVNQSMLHSFLSICTGVLMWSARSLMMQGTYSAFGAFVVRKAAQDAAAAGFVCLCLANFILIIAVGCISTGQTFSLPPLYQTGAGATKASHETTSSSSDTHASPYEAFPTDAAPLGPQVPSSSPPGFQGTSPYQGAVRASYAV